MLHVWFLYFFVWGGGAKSRTDENDEILSFKQSKDWNKDINTVDILHALTIFGIN